MKKLKKWLVINTVFSFTSGVLMMVFNQYLSNVFGIGTEMVFPLIGINLIVFAGFVLFVTKRHLQNQRLIYTICALDFLWVFGSIILFGLHPSSMLSIAYWITGLVAFFVGLMAVQQLIAFKNT